MLTPCESGYTLLIGALPEGLLVAVLAVGLPVPPALIPFPPAPLIESPDENPVSVSAELLPSIVAITTPEI
jgi:hypothetical protein